MKNNDRALKIYMAIFLQSWERLRSQPKNCVDLAMRALFGVVGAYRALKIQEFQIAVSLEAHSKQTIDEQDLSDVKILLDVCTNFLTINDNDGVRLVHYTVQEYLLEISIVPTRQDLALELSILYTVYLSLDVFRNEPAYEPTVTIHGPPEERFMYYTERYFCLHITACKDDKGLLTKPLLRLLGPGWERVARFICPKTPSLFIAVMLGKAEVV